MLERVEVLMAALDYVLETNKKLNNRFSAGSFSQPPYSLFSRAPSIYFSKKGFLKRSAL